MLSCTVCYTLCLYYMLHLFLCKSVWMCSLVCVPLCLRPDGCGGVQTAEPVTVTNSAKTDTRGRLWYSLHQVIQQRAWPQCERAGHQQNRELWAFPERSMNVSTLECQPLALSIRLCVNWTDGYKDRYRHTHTWKRPSIRPGKPDRHLTLDPPPPPSPNPNPLSSLTLLIQLLLFYTTVHP